MTKRTAQTKTHIRCGCPDCDWGAPFCGFSEHQMDRYRAEFRDHCIERHGLSRDDTERVCWFNLEALTLTLVVRRC